MSNLKVDCDWRDDTLYIVLPKDPERIGVRLFPSRQAPVRRYVPEAELLRLKERYAKLLDEKIDAYNDMRAATLEADELGAENAKLRELLRDILPFIAEEAGNCVPSECFMYPVCCEDTSDSECPVVARIHERARELGVGR